MNESLPNHTEHKPTAFTATIFQLTISFHEERKYSLGLLQGCYFSIQTTSSLHSSPYLFMRLTVFPLLILRWNNNSMWNG